MTWYFQKVVTRQFFMNHPRLYQCIMIFYVVGFGIDTLYDVTRVETFHGNNIWMTLAF